MGRGRVSWREMEQKAGVQTSRKTRGRKTAEQGEIREMPPPRNNIWKGDSNFCWGNVIVVLTNNSTDLKPPANTCVSKDERNVIQKAHPNPAKDHRACGTHSPSLFSDHFLIYILCRNGRFRPSHTLWVLREDARFWEFLTEGPATKRRKRKRSYPRCVIYATFL